jgi:hypothetical protein
MKVIFILNLDQYDTFNLPSNSSTSKFIDPSSLKKDTKVIYKSKIANIPTPGYAGHSSIFIKPISYLNKEKIEQENVKIQENIHDELPISFQKSLNLENNSSDEVIFYLKLATVYLWI